MANLGASVRGECFVFVAMSHGGADFIEGVKGGHVSISRDIIKPFEAGNCPNLEGKPKIFLIQACRGSGRQTFVML